MYPPVRNDAPATSRPSTATLRRGVRLERLWAAIREFELVVPVPQPAVAGAAFAAPAPAAFTGPLLRSTTTGSTTGPRRPSGPHRAQPSSAPDPGRAGLFAVLTP